jgi:Aminomethyltransferase folate-binding domain
MTNLLLRSSSSSAWCRRVSSYGVTGSTSIFNFSPARSDVTTNPSQKIQTPQQQQQHQQLHCQYHRTFGTSATDGGVGGGNDATPLVKTALYEYHKQLGGDMVPFAGYELPVLYKGENGGVMKEHLWCRSLEKAALFDVSHMGQVRHRNVGKSCCSSD